MTLVLSIISLVYMFAVIVLYAVRYIRADRAKRYDQLKNFRKGAFGLIYLSALPLYLAGNLYNGSDIAQALIDSFSNALSLVVLSFKWSVVDPLIEVDLFYGITVRICFAAAICNAGLFTFSLLMRRMRNRWLLSRIERGERPLAIIVGFNERTKQMLKSLVGSEYSTLLLAPQSDGVREISFLCDCATLEFSYSDDILPILSRYATKTDRRMVRMIVDTGNEETNFLIASAVGDFSSALGLEHFSLDGKFGFSAYVFGSDESESSFIRLSEKTHGCVQCVNRHKLLALDFVSRHPITERLKDGDVLSETLTVSPNVTLNFIMVGFGRLSRQILRSYAINSQLLECRDGKILPKTVNYRVYDIKETEKDKNLNHNLLRYAAWYKREERDERYPKPESIFNIGYCHMDIGDMRFYKQLHADLTSTSVLGDEGRAGLRNSILVSCDNDLMNVDFAEKLYAKLREWGLDGCTQIYVRIRDDKIRERVINASYPNGEIIAFGSENEIVAKASSIFSEGTEAMAKRQHLNYTKTDNADKSDEEIEKLAIRKWYDSWTHVQRESNTYACLSARVKLQLFGFDIAPLDDERPDASDAFREAYFAGRKGERDEVRMYSREELSDYSVHRHMITRMEHQRWNAYMIACGYVPAEPSEYLSMSKGELHSVRKHANIVSFEELINQRRVLSEHFGCTEEEADVIKYDYRLTDFLPELLSSCNLKIVKTEKKG